MIIFLFFIKDIFTVDGLIKKYKNCKIIASAIVFIKANIKKQPMYNAP